MPAGDAEPAGLLIDFAQEVYRETHVYALHRSSGSDCPCEINA